jgi:hypothetical protein
MVTIGGGIVLDERPQRHKRFKTAVLEKLQDLEKEDPLPFVLQKLRSVQGGTLQELNQLIKMGADRLRDLLDAFIRKNPCFPACRRRIFAECFPIKLQDAYMMLF